MFFHNGKVVRGGGGRRPGDEAQPDGRALRGERRLPDRRREGRARHEGRRHGHPCRRSPPTAPLPGYKDVKPMVFSGMYPTNAEDFEDLRSSIEKLQLNDSSLDLRAGDIHGARVRIPVRIPRPAPHGDRPGAARARVQPEHHQHRPERRVPGHHKRTATSCSWTIRRSCRRSGEIEKVEEPFIKAQIIVPTEYVGNIMKLCMDRRGRVQEHDLSRPDAGGHHV